MLLHVRLSSVKVSGETVTFVRTGVIPTSASSRWLDSDIAAMDDGSEALYLLLGCTCATGNDKDLALFWLGEWPEPPDHCSGKKINPRKGVKGVEVKVDFSPELSSFRIRVGKDLFCCYFETIRDDVVLSVLVLRMSPSRQNGRRP